MQKKRLLVSLFLFLFAASLISSFAAAQAASSAIFDPIKDMFASWQRGNLSVNIAKYLLVILLAAVIYSILDLTPFMGGENKSGLRWVAAVIVAFLGIAYLKPEEIYAVLASYSALGFVLSAAIPFVILLFLSIRTHMDGGPMGRIFARLIWFAFIIFLVYKLISGYELIGTGMVVGYLIFLGFSVIWILYAEKKFVKWMFKEELNTAKEMLERNLKESQAYRKATAQSARDEVKDST